MMYGFMAIRAIEIVEMAFRRKLTPKKKFSDARNTPICIKSPYFQSAISREPLKLRWRKSRQIKVHSIFFRLMYGFMAIWAMEMVKMATWKKSTQKKVSTTFEKPLRGNKWSYQSNKITKWKLIQFPFEWCIISWSSESPKWSKQPSE